MNVFKMASVFLTLNILLAPMSGMQETVDDAPIFISSFVSSPSPPPTHTRSRCFYYDTVTFPVEGVLYKVPRERFNESPVFRDMFSLPQGTPSGATPEGSLSCSPITLVDVERIDFESFLGFITP